MRKDINPVSLMVGIVLAALLTYCVMGARVVYLHACGAKAWTCPAVKAAEPVPAARDAVTFTFKVHT